jgi:hypothetical protein
MRFSNIIILFFALNVFSQEKSPGTQQDTLFTKIDSLYREDQFYFAVTYNILQKTPAGFSQNGLSTGLCLGFLRDMPINKKRTMAIAAGFGFSYNKYHENLLVSESAGPYNYEIVEGNSYSKNKLEQVFVDLPVEFRWRNSTPESHKFWRVYAGFKARYLIYDKTIFVGETTIRVQNNKDFNKWQYGPYIAFGYNTWNFHVYYGLNPLYKSAKIGEKPIDMQTLNLGLMFYIL